MRWPAARAARARRHDGLPAAVDRRPHGTRARAARARRSSRCSRCCSPSRRRAPRAADEARLVALRRSGSACCVPLATAVYFAVERRPRRPASCRWARCWSCSASPPAGSRASTASRCSRSAPPRRRSAWSTVWVRAEPRARRLAVDGRAGVRRARRGAPSDAGAARRDADGGRASDVGSDPSARRRAGASRARADAAALVGPRPDGAAGPRRRAARVSAAAAARRLARHSRRCWCVRDASPAAAACSSRRRSGVGAGSRALPAEQRRCPRSRRRYAMVAADHAAGRARLAGARAPAARASPRARAAEHAAAAVALVLLLGGCRTRHRARWSGSACRARSASLVLLAGDPPRRWAWMLAATLATALVQLGWTMDRHPEPSGLGLVLAVLSSVRVHRLAAARGAAPARRSLGLARAARSRALLVPGRWARCSRTCFGDAAIGLVPLALGALAVAAAARARDALAGRRRAPHQRARLACGAALSLRHDRDPAAGREGVDHHRLGARGRGAARAVDAPRPPRPQVLRRWRCCSPRPCGWSATPRCSTTTRAPAWRIVNWLAYAYLVPAAALVPSARTAGRRSRCARLRGWERPFYFRERPLRRARPGSRRCSWSSSGSTSRSPTGSRPPTSCACSRRARPAEKLVLSIAWALYAVALLVLGVRLQRAARCAGRAWSC